MAYKTRYSPKNVSKYKGDPTNIICRSLWERRFCKYCDEKTSILQWASEEFCIPYVSPVDGRAHRYFPDFWIKVQARTGVREFVIEVKPKKQTLIPEKPSRRTKRYLTEVATYAINQAKWEAANAYCTTRGWTFLVITEDELFGTFT